MDEKKRFDGKKVYIRLNSGRNYTGIITNQDTNFIYLLDKYSVNVALSIKDIEVIEEVRI